MSDQTSSTTPGSFTIGIPPEWFELDVNAPDVSDQIHRLVEGRLSADDESAPLVRLVEGQLRTFVAQARNIDVSLAAGFTELVVDDRDPADIGPDDLPLAPGEVAVITANLLVSLHGTDSAITAEELGSMFKPGTGTDGSDRTVELIDLPAGEAVCLKETRPEWFEEAPDPGFFRFVQYLLPVPGGEGTAALTFSTPSLAFVEDFEDVFLAVASTFAFLS